MKKHLRSFFCVFQIFVLLSASFLSIFPQPVHASTPYTASDVMGQRTVAGERSFTRGGVNSAVDVSAEGMDSPQANVVDAVNHRLFVADWDNSRVLVFNLDSNNYPLDAVPDYVLGQADFVTGTQPASVAANNFIPSGLAIDQTNNRLFISDWTRGRVLVFDTTTISNNENAVNVLGQTDFTSDGADIVASGFNYPESLIFDNDDKYLYVADSSNRVLVFDLTTITNNEDAIYVLGQPDFTSFSGDMNSSGFNSPRAIALDPTGNRLFVSDGNNRVLVFSTVSLSNNMAASNVLGQADFTSFASDTNAKGFYVPMTNSLVYDDDNDRLFVGDYRHRILVFDVGSITDNEDAVYVLGQADFTSISADTNAKGFNTPYGMSYVSAGYLYISDAVNNRVLIFNTSTISNNEDAVDVLGQLDANGDGDLTKGGQNNNPWGEPNAYGFYHSQSNGGGGSSIDYDNHRLFVAEYGNNRVLVFNLNSSNELIDFEADYVLGQSNFNGSASSTSATGLNGAQSAVYDSVNNRLFVQDLNNNRIQVYDTTTIINGEAALYSIGSSAPDQQGGGGSSASKVGYGDTLGMAFDPGTEYLYVMDTGDNNRILVFDVDPDNPSFGSGMNASYAIGTNNINSAGNGGCAANEIGGYYSSGIALDLDRDLLFASNDNCSNVLVYDISSLSTGMSADYVLGCQDFSCGTPANNEGTISTPQGMSYDSVHKLLYVYDAGHDRVMVFDVETITNGEDSVGLLGQSNYSDYTTGTTNALMNSDYIGNGAFDTVHRRLYYPDMTNNRIMLFDFANISTTSLSSGVLGTSYTQAIATTGTQGTTVFSISSGSLPPGLTINTTTGTISGTPTTAGSYSFTVQVSDDNGTAGTYIDTQDYTMTISAENVMSSVSSPKPDGEHSTTEAPVCNIQQPGTPELFQLDRGYGSATIHFAPLADSVSSYFISYGTDERAEGFSLELPLSKPEGVVSQIISALSPYQTYYFKVRAQQGCMPGPWSQVKQSKVGGNVFINKNTEISKAPSNTKSKALNFKQNTKKKITNTKPQKTPKVKTCFLFWCW